MDRERLDYLIGGFCDHSFTAEEAAELNARLALSEEARRRFVILVDLHRQLSEWHAAGTATGERTACEAHILENPDAFMRALMVRYLEGSLDALGTEALQVFLQGDPKAREEFARLAEGMGQPLALDEKPVLYSPAASGVLGAARSSVRRRAVSRRANAIAQPAFTPRVWMAVAAVLLFSMLAGVLWWSLWIPEPLERRTTGRTVQSGRKVPTELPAPMAQPPRPLPPEPGADPLGPPLLPQRSSPAERAQYEERRREENAELQRLIQAQQRWLHSELPRARPADLGDEDLPLEPKPDPSLAGGAETEPVPVGQVIFVEPEAKDLAVVRTGAGREVRTPLVAGTVLWSGDRIEARRADERACAALRLEGGATIDLAGETTVEVRGAGQVRLESGRIYACYKPELRDDEKYGLPLALETNAGRYLTEGARMDVSVSPKISVPAQTVARIDAGRVHLVNDKGHVSGVRGQELQAVAGRVPARAPALGGPVWRGRDPSFGVLPFGAGHPLLVLNEDPFNSLLEDYAFALSHDRSRTVLGVGVGGPVDVRERWSQLGRYARTLKSRGLQNLPEILQGCNQPLFPPASGRVEETAPVSSPVVRRLVDLARQARSGQAAVVVCAGTLTDLASAWLLEPACSERLIAVLGVEGGYRCVAMDPWAAEIVLPRFRCVVLSRTYAMGLDPERFDRVRDPWWSQLPRKEGSKDLPLLAVATLPNLATQVERSVCIRTGPGTFRFDPQPDGRIWLVKKIDTEALEREAIQTFFSP